MMMLDVAGGVIIAAAICGLFAFGVFSLIDLANRDWRARGLETGPAWVCICLSLGAAIWIVLI